MGYDKLLGKVAQLASMIWTICAKYIFEFRCQAISFDLSQGEVYHHEVRIEATLLHFK